MIDAPHESLKEKPPAGALDEVLPFINELERLGYRYWDTINIAGQGITWIWHKEVNGVRLTIDYWLDNQGEEWFIRAELSCLHRYHPDAEWMAPVARLTVEAITRRYFRHLPEYEAQLLAAIQTLIELV